MTIGLRSLTNYNSTYVANDEISREHVSKALKLTENGKIDYRRAQKLAATDATLDEARRTKN